MFNEIISATGYTDKCAESYFERIITGSDYNGDFSFVSTLRALVSPRIKGGDTLRLSFKTSGLSKRDLDKYSSTYSYFKDRFGVYPSQENELKIYNIICNSCDKNEIQNYFECNFCNTYTGYSRVEKVTNFYIKAMDVECFVNPDRKSSVIVVFNMDMRKMHYLQCGVLAYLPWYFNPDDGIKDIEMELVKSLREKTSDKYIDVLSRMIDGMDFRIPYIKSQLEGFESQADREMCSQLESEVRRLMEKIEEYSSRMMDIYREQQNYNIQIIGLKNKIEESDGNSEIMDYFINSKYVELVSVNNKRLTFVVRDYLTTFDVDFIKTSLERPNSYLYKPGGTRPDGTIISPEDVRLLMNAIFIDNTVKVRMCSNYTLELGYGISASRNFRYPSSCNTYSPNPHIDFHACLGGFRSPIDQCIIGNDYIMAIENCIASCRSINVSESATMEPWLKRVYGYDSSHSSDRFIELPDGSVVNTVDAILWLRNNKSKEEE